ncbi:MAG: prenyltransferase, partial [Verrucomicrobiota bacterium]|nr:prenyltransferase [Verrucomicrobiota bacterium]
LRSDQLNRHAGPFTGGSRILVEGRLSATALRRGRVWALLLFIVATAALAGVAVEQRGALFTLLGAGAVLGIGYSAPPLKLVYRGLGELDVAFTHSALVILLGYASQGGDVRDPAPWSLALPLFCGVLPAIILAGFPDWEADRAAGKKTLAVRLGRPAAALLALFAAVSAAVLLLLMPAGPAPASAIGALGCFVAGHAVVLSLLIARFLRRQTLAGRIDGLLLVSLSYMIWFAALPLWVLWSQLRDRWP